MKMILKDKSWTKPFSCTGSMLLFPSPFSMLMIVIHLIASGSSQAQKSPTQPPASGSLIGQLCCPTNHFLGPEGCSPLSNGTVFNPPIRNKNTGSVSPDDIIWEYRTLECPSDYEAHHYPLNESTNILVLTKSGTSILFIMRDLLRHIIKNFCVSLLPSGKYIGVTCRPNTAKICTNKTCVQKCCDDEKIVSLNPLMCRPSISSNFAFEFRTENGSRTSRPTDLQILYQTPVCESAVILLNPENKTDEQFYLLENGFLYQPAKQKIFEENRFCLDYFLVKGVQGKEPAAFVCSGPGLSTEVSIRFRLYAVGVMISAIFLLVTILCHIFIPELRNTHGLCLLCHMISLLVAEVALFIGYIFSSNIHIKHCVFNGYLLQFSLSAAFFWLNVLCFDIWWSIRSTTKNIPSPSIQANDNKKFKIYSAYAWGGPFLLTLVTVILHNLPDNPDQNILKPDLGKISCWFYGDLERLAYFYGVSAVLFTGNILLLGHTILMLYQAGAAFQCCRRSLIVTDCNRSHLEAFWLRFSLFTLMALCWATEILSWKIPPEELWIPTDILNTLQGFFVFVIFISSKKKRDLVKATLSRTTKPPQLEEAGVMCHINKSSSTYGTLESHSNDVATEVELNEHQVMNPSFVKNDS